MPASAAVAALGAFAAAGWLVLFAKETLQPAKEAAGLPGCFLFAFAAAVRGVFARLKTRLLAPRLARLEPTLVASRFPRAGIAAFPPVARLEGAPILATRGGALGFPANLRPAGGFRRQDIDLRLGFRSRGRDGSRRRCRSRCRHRGRSRGDRSRGGSHGFGRRGRTHGGFPRERITVLALRGDHLEGAGFVAGRGCRGVGGGAGGRAFATGQTRTASASERAEGRCGAAGGGRLGGGGVRGPGGRGGQVGGGRGRRA